MHYALGMYYIQQWNMTKHCLYSHECMMSVRVNHPRKPRVDTISQIPLADRLRKLVEVSEVKL